MRAAYRFQAPWYDRAFGAVSRTARRRAVDAVNALPGRDVLEAGVGTGLALPFYRRDKRVTGIDLSPEMLARAAERVRAERLDHVVRLEVADAEATGLPDASFDIAVAMFVASVVPNPARLLAEMKRLVRPGGTLIFVNHFMAEHGARRGAERALAPLSRRLGWHPDFAVQHLLPPADHAAATMVPCPPLGLFTLVQLSRGDDRPDDPGALCSATSAR